MIRITSDCIRQCPKWHCIFFFVLYLGHLGHLVKILHRTQRLITPSKIIANNNLENIKHRHEVIRRRISQNVVTESRI